MTHLPQCVFCPFRNCPWRGNRRYDFKKHWKRLHSGHGEVPEEQKSQIYDADALVERILDGELNVKAAAETIALPMVGMRVQELGKIGIWADMWGRRMRNSE